MKIGIIGQGACGLYLGIMLKQKDINNDIYIIDKNQKPGRKLYVTGNGRANIGNNKIEKFSYNNSLANNLVKTYDNISLKKFLNSIGIGVRYLNNLMYPFSLSAKAYVDYLIKLNKEYKVHFINLDMMKEYTLTKDNMIEVTLLSKKMKFDKLIICSGGKSHSILGSDGKVFDILKKHKYKITKLNPGLVPIKVKEKVNAIENERLKAKITLYIDKHNAYEEEGEVLIKKDGLSGICIFNASSIIARDPGFKEAKIYLDLFADLPLETLTSKFIEANKVSKCNFLEGYFNKNMAEYIRKNSGVKNLMVFDNQEIKKIAKFVKNIEFTYASSYTFNDSQVTVGGIDINEVNDNLESKKEKNVYFAGEILDLDGLCGGYNLMLCYATSKKIADSI
ncbi:MAG: aminoacetone oxidase family FAD-binding enzyme [Bacilli bacterium]